VATTILFTASYAINVFLIQAVCSVATTLLPVSFQNIYVFRLHVYVAVFLIRYYLPK